MGSRRGPTGRAGSAHLRALARSSIDLIAANQHESGAYPASPTFPVYRYSWFRDGAFIADAMSRAGRVESADRFFAWCSDVIVGRAARIAELVECAERGERPAPELHLPTRYTLDGQETGEDWWDFQLDGYGTWMWALCEHLDRHDRAPDSVGGDVGAAVDACARYLCAYWDEPCYDWWEERTEHVHTSTLGAVHAGLGAAAKLGADRVSAERCRSSIVRAIDERATVDGHLVKVLDGGPAVDASLVACLTPFGVVEADGVAGRATYEAVVAELAPDGVHRYLDDTYYGGGRWVVLAGLVGWHEAATGRTRRARERLEWMCGQRTEDGLLPEQVATHALAPSFVDGWVAKWGPIATPLLWSHAMYVTLAHALGLLDD